MVISYLLVLMPVNEMFRDDFSFYADRKARWGYRLSVI